MSDQQKPLLDAPLTHEDLDAWSYCYSFVEGEAWDAQMIAARSADRRDAELMLQRTLATAWGGVKGARLVIGKNRKFRWRTQA